MADREARGGRAGTIELALDLVRGEGARAFRLHVDLAVPARGVTAIFGASGAGKSSLLRAVAGLERGAGRVVVEDEVWQDDAQRSFLPTHRRGVGFVFQNHPLFAHLDVRANLTYGQTRRRGEPRRSLPDVVAMLGLAPLLARRTAGLSGGERQRVALGQALLAAPRVLLLDEPLAALDAARKQEVLPYLERVRDEGDVPLLYVSHALDEVARLADRVVLLEHGTVRASGPTGEVFARLDVPLVQRDDAGAVLEVRVKRHDERYGLTEVEARGGTLWMTRIASELGAPLRVRALARDVSLALVPPARSSILNVLPARVEAIEAGVSEAHVRLVLGHEGEGAGLLARVSRRSVDALGLAPGLTLYALVKGVALLA